VSENLFDVEIFFDALDKFFFSEEQNKIESESQAPVVSKGLDSPGKLITWYNLGRKQPERPSGSR